MLQQNFTNTKCLIQQIPLPSLKQFLLNHQPSIKLLLNNATKASLLLIHLNVETKIYFLRMVYPFIKWGFNIAFLFFKCQNKFFLDF